MPMEPEILALRLPHQIKAAVAALTDLTFSELCSDNPIIKNYVELPTNSSAMVYLMRTGLWRTLTNIEAEIAEISPLVSKYEEMVFFFLQNSAAQYALPKDFTESSPAGTFIEQLMDECEEDDIDAFRGGIERDFAFEELTLLQRKLIKLMDAKEKLQRALLVEQPRS